MKSVLTLLLAIAATARAQFAVMHTNGVVTSPANLTIQQSNVAGLAAALNGKLGTNPTLAISNTSGLQAALDGKLSTNGTLQVSNVSGLQVFLDTKLGFNSANGQIQWTNTNALTFTNRFSQASDSITNPPEIRLVTKSNNVASWFYYDASAAQTNPPAANWSVMWLGNNHVPAAFGYDRERANQLLGAVSLTMENHWITPVMQSPVSETYFNTTDTNGLTTRSFFIMGSQTNANLGFISTSYPMTVLAGSNTIGWYNGASPAALTIYSDQQFLINARATTPATSGRITFGTTDNGITAFISGEGLSSARHFAIGRSIYRMDANGVVYGSQNANLAALAPVHLADNTRIDGFITFNNTTNAATTRTNLGLGNGITTNVSSGTLQFSNGILVGHTP